MPGDYSFLIQDSSFAVTDSSDLNIPDVSGYIFDLFQADVSLAVDPSFAAQLLGGSGFTDINAVAKFDLSASSFNNLFFITVDSSDIDDTSANDVVFSIDSSFVYPFVDSDGSGMAFSKSIIQHGSMNSQYADQSLKKDVVRHIAHSITGGYAVADIFSNEADLLADVEAQDVSLHDILGTAIDDLKDLGGKTVDQINNTDIGDPNHLRFFQVAQALFSINLNDSGTDGRQEEFFADLSDSSVDSSGDALASSVTVPLKFRAGDAIALRIQYDPNSSPVGGDTNGDGVGLGGMGNNTISSRSYKILIPLS